jgi:serine-type anaerobic sulfatase-maturating enzyme
MACDMDPTETISVPVDKNNFTAGSALMIKPVGALCNLRCEYCYYLDTADDVFDGRVRRMSVDTLERVLGGYLPSAPDRVTIAWQGGEPTLAGLGFFEEAVRIQREFQRGGQVVSHGLQTNGTLLDDGWCRFFKREKFLVGISIDGSRAIHDRFRRDNADAPTHNKVIAGLKRLRRHGVEHNVLCVLHRDNVKHPRHLLEYLVGLGENWLQFIPAVEWDSDPATGEPKLSELSPLPEDYGRFLCEVFDLWFEKYRDRVSIRLFDTVLNRMVMGRSSLCILSDSCHGQMTVEHNGDVFGCDHYVFPQWLLGSVRGEANREAHPASQRTVPMTIECQPVEPSPVTGDRTWMGRLDTSKINEFDRYKLNLTPTCDQCQWLGLCFGGCPKHRPHRGVVPEPTVLCEGYLTFFNHAMPRLQWLSEHLRRGAAIPPPRG